MGRALTNIAANRATAQKIVDWRRKSWRREWDSNPRYGFPHTRFPSVRLKPLGHLSGALSLEGAPVILQGTAGKSGEFFRKVLYFIGNIGRHGALRNCPRAEPEAGLARRFTRDHRTSPGDA